MKYDNDLNWNSYHSSPEEISKYQDFLNTKSIAYLILLRDFCLSVVKEKEADSDFYSVVMEEESDQSFRAFQYEDALTKVSYICGLIKRKRDGIFMYTQWSPERKKYIMMLDDITSLLKKKASMSYGEIVDKHSEISERALDYLIEAGTIETIGSAQRYRWKVHKYNSHKVIRD